MHRLAALLIALPIGAAAPPGEQPDWPFAWRVDPGLLADPAVREQVAVAFAVLAAGIGCGILGAGVRKARWPGLALGSVLAALAVTQMAVLVVPAVPTSFWRSPTGFTAHSVEQGRALFADNCAACHGAGGRGDGGRGDDGGAASLATRPADLTAPHVLDHSDGQVFWWLTHGISGVGGGLAMPGFDAVLDPGQRWALIDFVRANAAGAALSGGTDWVRPLRPPELVATCRDGNALTLEGLRGRPVRLVAVGDQPIELAIEAELGLVTIALAERAEDVPPGTACAAIGPEVWAAYATIGGVGPECWPGARS